MNLFADTRRFRAWLADLPADGTAGYRGDAANCPLAQWLSEELLGVAVFVDGGQVRLGRGFFGYVEALPPVLIYFIERIDAGLHGRMGPAEALEALDAAEQLAAQLQIPEQASAAHKCVYHDEHDLCAAIAISPVLHTFVSSALSIYEYYECYGRLCAQHVEQIVVPLPEWWGRGKVELEMPLEDIQAFSRKRFFQARLEEIAEHITRRVYGLEEVEREAVEQ